MSSTQDLLSVYKQLSKKRVSNFRRVLERRERDSEWIGRMSKQLNVVKKVVTFSV